MQKQILLQNYRCLEFNGVVLTETGPCINENFHFLLKTLPCDFQSTRSWLKIWRHTKMRSNEAAIPPAAVSIKLIYPAVNEPPLTLKKIFSDLAAITAKIRK